LSPYTPHPLPQGERIKRFIAVVRFVELEKASSFAEGVREEAKEKSPLRH